MVQGCAPFMHHFQKKISITKKVSYLWMNARVKALDFYLKLDYTNSEITYNMNEIGLHYMLYKKL